MEKFVIPPDNASYTFEPGSSVLSTKMMGGASRYRKDLINPTSKVSVNWTTDTDGYLYIRSFFRAIIEEGSLPFLIDLVLDEPGLTEHKAYFVPGSFRLNSQKGLTYSVSAELEVYQAAVPAFAKDFVYIYNEFGNTFRYYENALDILINESWPDALNV